MMAYSSHPPSNDPVFLNIGTGHPTNSAKKWHYVITFQTSIAQVESNATRKELEKSIVPLRAEWTLALYRQASSLQQEIPPHPAATNKLNSYLEGFGKLYLEKYEKIPRRWPHHELSLSNIHERAQWYLHGARKVWPYEDVEVSVVKPSQWKDLKQDRGMAGCRWELFMMQADSQVGLLDIKTCQDFLQSRPASGAPSSTARQSEEVCIRICQVGPSTSPFEKPQTKSANTSGTQASHRAIAPKPAGYNSNTNSQEYTAHTSGTHRWEYTGETYYDPTTGTLYRPYQQ